MLSLAIGQGANDQTPLKMAQFFGALATALPLALVGAIPAVGSIYGSFRRMGDAMLESSVDNFQEVVLVEYPTEGSYAVAFKTADTPEVITDDTGTPSCSLGRTRPRSAVATQPPSTRSHTGRRSAAGPA